MDAGATLELSHTRDREQRTFYGRLIWSQAGRLAVALPAAPGEPGTTIHPGDSVACTWRQGNQVQEFQAMVVSRDGLDPVVLVLSRQPVGQQPVQRRDFFRLRARRSVRYQQVSDEPEQNGEKIRAMGVTATTDLSGGGIALRLAEELPRGTLLDLVITLPDREIQATAEVLRTAWERGEFITAVRFIDIAEKDRASLIRYILREAWLNGAAPPPES